MGLKSHMRSEAGGSDVEEQLGGTGGKEFR